MAVTVATGNGFLSATAYGNVSKQFVNNITSGGSLLVAFVSVNTASLVTLSCSDDVNGSWTALTAGTNSGLVTQLQIFYKYNSASGGKPTVSITGLAAQQSALTIAEFIGVQSSSDPIDGSNSNSVNGGSGNPTSGSFTTTANGLVVGYAEMYPAATPTAGTGYTIGNLINHSSGYPGGTEYKLAATAGSNAAVFGNASQSYWVGVGAAFKEAPPTSTSGTYKKTVVKVTQPQIGTPIDYSNPIAKGISSLINFNGAAYDAMRGKLLPSDSGVTFVPSDKGTAMRGGSGPDGIKLTSTGSFSEIASASEFSLSMLVRINSLGTRRLIAADYNSAGSAAGISIEQTALNYWWPQIITTAPQALPTAAVTSISVTTGWHWIEMTFKQNVGYYVYIDGTLLYSDTGSAVNNPRRTSNDYRIGRGGAYTGLPFDGDIGFHGIWNRVLTYAERLAIRTNPYQLFAPTRKFLPTAPSPKVVNQTITGVANIAASTITTTKTITGTGRVQKTVTTTETGTGRIQKVVNATETGTARISITTTKTETGISRIQKVVSATITGVANIASSIITTTKTITGTSRVTATTTRTETGTGRIQKTVSQTVQGVSRIGLVTTKTETGKARVQTVVSQTETGKARITATSSQTITGKARITGSGLVTVPMTQYSVELGSGVSKSLSPTGNMLEIEIVTTTPTSAPVNNRGVVFMVSGGVVTIYVWNGSSWIAK